MIKRFIILTPEQEKELIFMVDSAIFDGASAKDIVYCVLNTAIKEGAVEPMKEKVRD